MSHGTIETSRLIGERPAKRHVDGLLAVWGDPAVAAWLWPGATGGARSRPQVAAILAAEREHWRRHGFGVWVFSERDGGAIVGSGGLRRTSVGGEGGVEVLYSVASPRWGHGYGVELATAAVDAAAESRLPEVVGYTLPENVRSRRVLERAGIRFERELEHAGLRHWFGRRRLTHAQ